MSNIRNVLYQNEKILWEGRPEKAPYLTGKCLAAIPVFFFGLLFSGFVIVFAMQAKNTALSWAIFLFPHFWIGIGCMVFPFLSAFLSYSRIAYALTDKRALIESGIISHNIQSIDYDKLSNASVTTSPVDSWYGQNTGTIILSGALIATAGGLSSVSLGNAFSHIKDPYTVFRFFQKTELDVKTDIQYPNALRPAANPGYQSAYETRAPSIVRDPTKI